MKERRDIQSDRFSVKLKVRYYLQEMKTNWQECTITDISPSGAALEFHTSEKIDVGTTLFLEIVDSSSRESNNVQGIVRWVKEGKEDFSVGIKASSKSDEDKFAVLFTSLLEL
jgi:hypothetical protein